MFCVVMKLPEFHPSVRSQKLISSASATLGATFNFARLFVVSSVTKFFERAFFIQFLFQSAEGAVNRFAFLQTYFRCFHVDSPPFKRWDGRRIYSAIGVNIDKDDLIHLQNLPHLPEGHEVWSMPDSESGVHVHGYGRFPG